jgi:murein DD-endopeptidase MepM/ murein hydrolase activator NlpD
MYFFLKQKMKFGVIIIAAGYLIPGNISSPIEPQNITKIDPESFWYYPWGESGVHKGVDIFCEKGTAILSPVSGFVISNNYGSIGGNYVYIIGAKWRTYYFAHMDTVFVNVCRFVKRGDIIGRVGNTGNVAGKPAHLHFAIETLFPYVWLYDSKAVEGWKKMYYLNPLKELNFPGNTEAIH